MKKELFAQLRKIDPRNIDVEWIEATRVIFETPKGDYILTKPKVLQMDVNGTIAYQIAGVKPEFIAKKEEKKEA